MLQTEIAHAIRAMDCILDGEIVVLAPDGRSKFYDLLFRREWPHFIAFDVLAIGSEDLRHRPLLERKRRLKRIMPPPELHARLLYHDHVEGRGVALFDAIRGQDLEGVVAKWKRGRYHTDGQTTSWLKVRNPMYSQMEHRRDVFAARRSVWTRSRRRRLCSRLSWRSVRMPHHVTISARVEVAEEMVWRADAVQEPSATAKVCSASC